MRLPCPRLRALRHNCGSGRASAGLHGPVGTSVAFLIAIYGKAREGRRRQGIRRKPGSCKSLALGDTKPRDRIITRTTLLHTQASDRHPAQAGFFLGGCRQICPCGRETAQRCPRPQRLAARGVGKEGEAARELSMRFHSPCRTAGTAQHDAKFPRDFASDRLANRTGSVSPRWSSQSKGRNQPHLESPQFRHVMQPSIMTTAAVLQRPHSCAPSGKCALAKASACLLRAWNSARFSSTSFC